MGSSSWRGDDSSAGPELAAALAWLGARLSRRAPLAGAAAATATGTSGCRRAARTRADASSSSTSRCGATRRRSARSWRRSRRETRACASSRRLLPERVGRGAPVLPHRARGRGRATSTSFIVDVIWVAEFARAGWIADLSDASRPRALRARLPPRRGGGGDRRTAARSPCPGTSTWGSSTAAPTSCPRAPRTYDELVEVARTAARERGPGCTATCGRAASTRGWCATSTRPSGGTAAQSHARGARSLLDTPSRARARLRTCAGWSYAASRRRRSPRRREEESRRVFQEGRAVFMRNWPYAVGRGRAPGLAGARQGRRLAAADAERRSPAPGALGGWQLAVNAHSPAAREAALALIAHLTSPEANLDLAVRLRAQPAARARLRRPARSPPARRSSPRCCRSCERARPRPVTPYYRVLSRRRSRASSPRPSGRALARGGAPAARRALVDHLAEAPRELDRGGAGESSDRRGPPRSVLPARSRARWRGGSVPIAVARSGCSLHRSSSSSTSGASSASRTTPSCSAIARFWTALGNTAYFAAVAVAVELALGLAFALLLESRVPRARAPARVGPGAVGHPHRRSRRGSGRGSSTRATGRASPRAAPHAGRQLARHAGLRDARGHPRRRLEDARPSWRCSSSPGLQTSPTISTARRASTAPRAAATFRAITLPLLRPTIAVALAASARSTRSASSTPSTCSPSGGPANTTETLSIYAYKTLMRAGDFGYGSTLAVVTFLVRGRR